MRALKQRIVAEIVGPAGAGKSALARALRGRDAAVRTRRGVWGLPPSSLLAGALASLPALFRLWGEGRRISWGDFGLIARLDALHRLLGRKPGAPRREGDEGDEGEALLLDEGAVFALAKLRVSERERSRGAGWHLDCRAQSHIARYAERLDAVIWLDADDAVLARRIRERDKPHRLKGGTNAEIQNFLALYRDSYRQVLAELSARRGLKVIRLNTNGESPERLADLVLSEIRGARVQARGARDAA